MIYRETEKRSEHSEAQMTDAFLRCLRSRKGLPGVGPFWKVFQEVSCLRGRPDLIGIQKKDASRLSPRLGHVGRLAESDSAVMSLLSARQPHSVKYLHQCSGFVLETVQKALRRLCGKGLAHQTRNGTWLLECSVDLSNLEVWAFELKIRNVRRAVFQAQQYAMFAQRVCIVLPPQRAALIPKFEKALACWNIGVALFEPRSGAFELRVAPKRNIPVSRRHEVYALFGAVQAG